MHRLFIIKDQLANIRKYKEISSFRKKIALGSLMKRLKYRPRRKESEKVCKSIDFVKSGTTKTEHSYTNSLKNRLKTLSEEHSLIQLVQEFSLKDTQNEFSQSKPF